MEMDLDEIVREERKRLSYTEAYILAKIVKSASSSGHSGEATLHVKTVLRMGYSRSLECLNSKAS